jgi:hypothetical protein
MVSTNLKAPFSTVMITAFWSPRSLGPIRGPARQLDPSVADQNAVIGFENAGFLPGTPAATGESVAESGQSARQVGNETYINSKFYE